MQSDKYRNHPRNRRSKKRPSPWSEKLKEKLSDIALGAGITFQMIFACLVPAPVSYFEYEWLTKTFPVFEDQGFIFIIIIILNYFLAIVSIYEMFWTDTPAKLWKFFKKAIGIEPLSINIPDYKSDNKYPEFEKQLKEEKFVSYVDLNGNRSKYLKISENDKWICFCGEYHPIDLIYARPSQDQFFYTIKGDTVSLEKDIPYNARLELLEFLKRRGNIIDMDPHVVRDMYWQLDYRGMYNVEKADWAGLRLAWEEAVAQKKHPKADGKKYKVVTDDGQLNPELFNRVLSNSEIGRIISALNQRTISPADVFAYDRYVNEYTVCNAIRIAEGVRTKYKTESLDFLFMCLNDIDEAYFHRAVAVILLFPHSMIKERLEEQALAAYNNQDALRLAGLLYIAHEINYEIQCLKDIKAELQTAPRGGYDVLEQVEVRT